MRRPAAAALCACALLLAVTALPGATAARQLREVARAPLCLAATGAVQSPAQRCFANPAAVFAPHSRGSAANGSIVDEGAAAQHTAAERALRAVVAQHVLCPTHRTQAACEGAAAAATSACSWDATRQACEADRFASLLLPLTCPGSEARAFLACRYKPSLAACKADPACAASPQAACHPAAFAQQARAANSTTQALAERMALAVLTGDARVLGDCAQAPLLRKVMAACPFSARLDECPEATCTIDTPSFVPMRGQALAVGGAGAAPRAASEAGAAAVHATGGGGAAPALLYSSHYPAPLCFVDTQRLPRFLSSLLGVGPDTTAALAAADARCARAESISFNAAASTAFCGFETVALPSAAALRQAVSAVLQPPAAGPN